MTFRGKELFDTFKRVAEPSGRKKLQCNDCRRSTIHTPEAQCAGNWSYEDPFGGHINGGTNFSLYRCGACDSVCFEKSSWNSESYDHDESGTMYALTEETQYPPPSSANFTFNTDYTPPNLNELIEEMLYALAGGKLNLATVGLRLVIEFIVNDTKCAGRNLKSKIEDLKAKNHIDNTQHDLLQKIREKGNDGAHKGIAMNTLEMVAGMGIVDLLLEKLYNGPGRHADVIKKANQAFPATPKTAHP